MSKILMQSAEPRLHLESYRKHVERTRDRFRKCLRSMPQPCREMAKSTYSKRLDESPGKLLLGEYSPWMFSEILECDPQKTSAAAVAWMHIYLAVLLLDDVFDAGDLPDKDRAALIIASEILVQRGLTMLSKLIGPTELQKIQPVIRRAVEETATAALRELSDHRGTVTHFTRDAMNLVGKKLSMLNICALGVAASSGKLPPRRLGSFVKSSALAFQLLDDLGDFSDDWCARSYTLPLTVALEKGYFVIPHESPRLICRQELLAVLIKSGALEECLAGAIEALGTSLVSLDRIAVDGSSARAFFESLRHACNELRGEVAKSRQAFLSRSAAVSDPWFVWADARILESIDSKLKIVAQSS